MKLADSIRANPGRSACGILGLAELKSKASHGVLKDILAGLGRLEHRGGSLDDTGDGAGVLVGTERSFFERFLPQGRALPSANEPLVVGTVFFLHGERNIPELKREVDLILRKDGLAPLGWRKVPVDESVLGRRAREDAPIICQIFVAKGHRREAQLFAALHQAKVAIEDRAGGMLGVVSLAPATTVYKALATGGQLAAFYADFKDPAFVTRVAVAHRRFSTNTFSNWNLVQPFRHIAHNGEINTITANCRAIRDAECAISLGNTLMNHGSDSAQLDRVAEMCAANGMSGIHEALRRMLPPAWMEGPTDEDEKEFFEANRRAMGTMGAWEGPTGIIATDGLFLTGIVDRMGLRPLRYAMTSKGRVILASEVGAIAVDPSEIISDGQLGPGEMVIADLAAGNLIPPHASTKWIVGRTGLNFHNLSSADLMRVGKGKERRSLSIGALNAFGWTRERIGHLEDTVKAGREPIVGMGNDSPLAIFSENHSRLFSFLHQIVAVVTNPPIDPLREGGAIDMAVYLGRSPRIAKSSDYKLLPQYELAAPILTDEELESLFTPPSPELNAVRIDAAFEDRGKAREIVRRIHDIAQEALRIIRRKEASILVVSDSKAIRAKRLPLPMILVVSAIHQALAANGLRRDASIVVETGEVHEGHDAAALLAYGATAVNPYAMFHIAKGFGGIAPDIATAGVVSSIVNTLRRIMSKMGITSLAGYRGSARFEAIGISSDVVEYYIPDTVSRLGGVTIEDIYDDIVARASIGDAGIARNQNTSVYRREITDVLQQVARNGNSNGDYDRFAKLLDETPPVYLRDMLEFKKNTRSARIDGVADEKEIIRTTVRGAAMSHGAINSLAHRAIAAAFNSFGSMSNSGEGGEDPRRNPGGEWERDRSRIRQIASGRFGVDAAYLVGADEIEIKIGQGAKPGEGGHLPGKKVTAEIASIRRTQAGIDLISPPPHHDIYSIEDLAQLITNLRELCPKADISVKVPAITDLGTISVGIAKAGADAIVISGFEGGTGAASLGSIAHAGVPLERGVAEVHQYLIMNGIRSRMRIRADGGIKSGMDAAKIVALGADEVSIGTPLLIAQCCVYCRGCSKGNCPVGIAATGESGAESRFMRRHAGGDAAAWDEAKRYEEARDAIARYLECFAGHIRRILARYGLSHPRELVGRVDLLEQRVSGNPRWDRLDLAELLADLHEGPGGARAISDARPGFKFGKNAKIVSGAADILEGREDRSRIELLLANCDHAVGATLSGELARRGILSGVVEIAAKGFAGQGFAFAATSGQSLRLEGYANDAVAEVMGGTARVVIVPPGGRSSDAIPHLIGNAAAYGATGGTLFVAGKAGQRFGVRNSGGVLVCEGVGKYAFEYMTGGIGIVLGECGPCIGSGMTGGEIFIHDPGGASERRLSPGVTANKIAACGERADVLKRIIEDYFAETGSLSAERLLTGWDEARSDFLHAVPH